MTHNVNDKVKSFLVFLILFCGMSNAAWADPTGDGSQASPYSISNADDLKWLGAQIKAGNTANGKKYGGKYWKLTADIDLGGIDWMTIINNNVFYGFFDGDNKTISNFTLSVTANSNYGLFPNLQGASTTNLAEVKNLKISDVTFTSAVSRANNTRLGALAGYVKQANIKDVAVSNVTFTYTNTITSTNQLGGAIGCMENNTTLNNVDVTGVTATFSSTTTGLYFGGIVGASTGTANTNSITGCDAKTIQVSHSSNITGTTYMGGLVGNANTSLNLISNNTVKGVEGQNEGKAFDVTVSGTTVNFYAGGLLGYTIGDGHEVKNNQVENIYIKNTGTINGGRLGGFIGYVESNGTTDKVVVKGNTASTVNITVDSKTAGTPYLGGFIGYVKGKASPDNRALIQGNTVTSPTIAMNGEVANTFYMGGFVGYADTHTNIYNNKVSTPALSLTDIANAATYIGGAVGAQNHSTTIDGMYVNGGSITGNTTANKTIKNNIDFFVGGFIGKQNNAGSAANQGNVFRNIAVNGMNIKLGHLIPAGNIKNHKFGVGGIAGTVSTSYQDKDGNRGMPENLIAKDVKIYAPYAATSPTIPNFNSGTHAHNNMTTDVVTTVDAIERSKSGTWLYNGYKLGLSPEFLASAKIAEKTAAAEKDKYRKNYSATPATEDDISYLAVDDNTFDRYNRYLEGDRDAKTVLWWTNATGYVSTGPDIKFFTTDEQPIYPNGSDVVATQYPYYMYFFQGVANAKHTEAANASNIIKGIEANITEAAKDAPLTLAITNANEGQRGFGEQTLSVEVASGDDTDVTYQWYVDGEDKDTGNSINVAPHWKLGKNIHVNAIKNSNVVASADYAMPVGVLKTKAGSTEKIRSDVNSRGTKANPYIIDSEDALRQFSFLTTAQTGTRWEELTMPVDPATAKASNFVTLHYNRAYYELEKDLDLKNTEFTPISHMGHSGDATWGSYNLNFIFQGHFDGKGHKISNFHITWEGGLYNGNDAHAYFGLFGAVGNATATAKWGDGTTTSNTVIKNLIIDGATLTHKTNNTSFFYSNITTGNSNNCHVGVLAGVVGSNTTIQNIEIRNSVITDNGSGKYSLAKRGLYVGGAIGSVQTGFNASNNASANTTINHVAAKVDITLTKPEFVNPTSASEINQFNVGGIIGRYCSTSATYDAVKETMPQYTFFSGRINAPDAWISPVIAAVRYTSQQGNNLNNYSKQWEGNNNTVASQFKIKNAQFSDFYIGVEDIQDGIDASKITETYPDNKCGFGNRTILLHTDAKESSYSAGKYQGVNYSARYIDGVGSPLELLNQETIDGYNWAWDDGFVHMTTAPYRGANITRDEENPNKFTASMSDGSTPTAYRWQASFDGTNWITIPNATSATYTVQENVKPMYIKASLTVDETYNTLSELVTSSITEINPTITDSKVNSNNVFTVDWQGNNPTEKANVTYQWYNKDKTTSISGATSNTLTLTDDQLVAAGRVVWCEIKVNDKVLKDAVDPSKPYVIASFMLLGGKTVVYVDGTNGHDNGETYTENDEEKEYSDRGWTPETPVKTINHANSLLLPADDGGTIDNNIVVIIGRLNPQNDDAKNITRSKYVNWFQSRGKNPATLTGNYDNHEYNGEIVICEHWQGGTYNVDGTENAANAPETEGHNCYVLADTKFEYLTFIGTNNGNSFIECHGNDVTFGKGLVMTGFANLSKTHGNFDAAQIIPELTIVLTATNLSAADIAKYTNRTKPQVVTFQSGHYGRIMGGRYTNNFFNVGDANDSHTILGSAEHPVWAVVNIDIDKSNSNSGYVLKNGDGKPATSADMDYSCDINCIIAGLTDGSMYGDYTINFHGGSVNYIVGGNQGNPVPNGKLKFTPKDGTEGTFGQWPNASYFGRTVINIDEDSNYKQIQVGDLYAGGLGREQNGGSATSIVDMYYYGHTEVNVKSGTVSGSVYAGGAGGVIGLNPWDAHVPYATDATSNSPSEAIYGGVQYGDNQFGGTWNSQKKKGDALADVILHNSNGRGGYVIESLNLANSSTTVNVTGGIIKGSVYGGGYGYVANMDEPVTMQGVGSVFGTSNVNISGGEVQGSVYGGSRGADKYYGFKNKYGQTIDHIAEMNGTVNINITGTAGQYPTIGGNIYGAGQGLTTQSIKAMNSAGSARDGAAYNEEFLTIARAGNTVLGDEYKTDINITIDLPETYTFAGNIYGGGEMGKVDGTTNIVIKGGKFTGKIFGGSLGESGHDNKALVTGTTNVDLAGGVVTDDIYGGGQIAHVKGNTNVMTEGGTAQSNIYGGGYLGTVSDMANVYLNGGDVLGNVFGGGYQAIVGTAKANEQTVADWVKTNGTTVTMNSTTANVYGDIFGGGNLANVEGNTSISLYAGNFAGNIFGGGNGKLNGASIDTSADVTGNTNIYIAQDEGGQDEETKQDNFSINVIWDQKWSHSSKSFLTWKDNKEYFHDGEKFLDNHNIYGGGNLASVVGTYTTVPGDLSPVTGTGKATVTVLKGMTPYALLNTQEWKDSYNDNENPHFYVFGGGYGVNTKVGSTDVTVNVDGEYGEYAAEVEEPTEQLAKPNNRTAFAKGAKAAGGDEQLPVFDNSKGIPNFTVLGVLGGGYSGLVANDTKVTVDGKTFLHRIYGGGFGDPFSTENNTTGQVGGNTEVFVNGAHTYGDVFGGGAGVAAASGAGYDLDNVARVLGKTSVTVADDARIYGKVYGGGDMASVGVAVTADGYTKTSGNYDTSVSSLSSYSSDASGATWTYTHSNHQSFVNILGGDIFGEVYGGGKGVKKAEANDYTKVGRIEGSTLVHIADNTTANTTPYVWNRIYGGCAYGTVDGNSMVHVEGGMLGLNIFGGGYGDMTIDDDQTDSSSGASTASSTLDQVLGKKDTEATFANILGNTKVQIDGGSWIWNQKADINGNITTWESASKKIGNDLNDFKALVAQIQQAETDEDLKKIEAIKAIDSNFFNLAKRQFSKNHNIFGGGNRACFVGTYSDLDASSNIAPAENTGKAEVIINHSPITKIVDDEGNTLNMLDHNTVAGLCWYLGINNISHPQFSVFGAGYGANTKVGETVVMAQPGAQLNGADGALLVPETPKYLNQASDLAAYFDFEQQIAESWKSVTLDEKKRYYGYGGSDSNETNIFLRYRASQLAWSAGAPNFTFMDIHGGGFSGYVVGNSEVSTDCQLNARNVFGAGLGAKPYGTIADQAAANAFTFGQVGGNSSVFIKSGVISLNVYGGGAGIESYMVSDDATALTDFPNIALVKGKTNVDVYGESIKFTDSSTPADLNNKRLERTIIFGSVYGGGDVANVGSLTTAGGTEKTATDAAVLTDANTGDFKSTVNVRGASIQSQVYAGGNGRLAEQCSVTGTQESPVYGYQTLGAIYGNTRLIVADADKTYPYETEADKKTAPSNVTPHIWNRIYGGCQNGTVYGNTIVDVEGGSLGHNIFGGGFGDDGTGFGQSSGDNDDNTHGNNGRAGMLITSANVTGNTNIIVNGGEMELTSFWLPDTRTWEPATITKQGQTYSPQYDVEARKFKINHNIFGGGNAACVVGNNTFITMNKGLLKNTTATVPGETQTNFFASNEWKEVYQKVGSPHFAVFGGGYGEQTVVTGNTTLDINMKVADGTDISNMPEITKGEEYKHFISGTSVMDIVGGGYSGKVVGQTNVNVMNDVFARRVFGGGFYNTVDISNVNITSIDCYDIFGGGLMGDINKKTNVNIGSLDDVTYNENIFIHGNIYGGNDVSGYINMNLNNEGYFQEALVDGGTNIKVYGGRIDGNVYGAGNGDYLYALDREGHEKVTVNEHYPLDPNDASSQKFDLVYTVPMRETMPSYMSASDAAKIVNINSYRPLTNRVNIDIQGADNSNTVNIRGDVYGGGNSATVQQVYNNGGSEKTGAVNFNIGKYVNIGRVFMGCNGDKLFTASEDNAFLADFQKLNNLHLDDEINWDTDPSNHGISTLYLPTENNERPIIYPHLLDLYFQPVEMDIQANLKWDGKMSSDVQTLSDCVIGTFCCGGNRGNMNVYPILSGGVGGKEGNVIDYLFPEGLTITDKIIGGCNNANYEWFNSEKNTKITHVGGYLLGQGHSPYPFIKLTVKNKFQPSEVEGAYQGGNVFGGCFYTGTIRGDISVDLRSDMLADKETAKLEKSNELLASDPTYAALNVYGAGYGMESYVYGNTDILFGEGVSCTAPTTGDTFNATGTSANFVYGGGQQGNVIGVTNVDVRNGHIYKSVTGGSYSGYVYGSTQIKVGYPISYKLNPGNAGRYLLKRTDENNLDVENINAKGETSKTIKQYINLIPGDVITSAVYDAIYAKYNGETLPATELSESDKATIFASETNTPTVGWDNVNIFIDEACYGGGYSLAQGSSVMANNTTVLKYTENYNINDTYKSGNLADLTGGTTKGTTVGFGGNTMMLIADATTQQGGATDRDHITISHQEMKEATLADGSDLFGYYYKGTDGNYHYISKEGTYIYHTGHSTLPDDASTTDNKVYKYDGEGGIFGDGHLSYAEGFRAADLTGYGFADTYINNPKIINTFQRMDILRLTDNCFTLLGARDYATNATNKTPYSISRVGEIQMIANNIVTENGTANGKLKGMGSDAIRSRNYMGLANNIHYVGAVKSSVPFTEAWRDREGVLGTGDNSGKSYEAIKQKYIDDYYNGDASVKGVVPVFQKRNDGTAKNMIGIASGYALKIQNVQEDASSGKVVDNIYYGPIYGVVEMNLIEVHEDEGGGYVYADNVHKRPTAPTAAKGARAMESPQGGSHTVDFLETTGNFVFPYDAITGRYIVDDCFPKGYDDLGDGKSDPDNAQDAEAHYWYVSGYNYYYKIHLTGYTYDSSTGEISFDSDNKDGLTVLAGLKPGQEVAINSWTMRSGHPNKAEHASYVCDLEQRNYDENAEDAGGNKVEGKYKLYVGAADSEKYDASNGFSALLPLDGTTPSINANTLPDKEHLTTEAKVTFRLTDQVNNTTSAYYNDHLSEPCYGTLVLSAPAMKYEKKEIEGEMKDVLVPQEGYIGITDFYVYEDGIYKSASEETIDGSEGAYSAKANTYYFKNGVTNEFTQIPDLKLLYTKDAEQDKYVCVYVNDTYSEININKSGASKKYYFWAPRTYTYTIYLTIDYVQGPNIEGNITVENCALPGEMIRVNKKNVQIQADESFSADGYYWRIGKRVKEDGKWKFVDTTPWTKEEANNNSAKGYDSYIQSEIAGTGKGYFHGCNYDKTNDYLDIPAYYYMNGYGIQLGVSMNGLEPIFPVNMTDDDQFVVHNYHRMKPRGATEDFHLHLAEAVARAKAEELAEPRIYISDTQDLGAFVDFLDSIGTARKTLAADAKEYVKVGARQATEADVTAGNATAVGNIINVFDVPRYGANAQFVIQNDLNVPAEYNLAKYTDGITFNGILHGDGHIITGLNADKALITTNNGHIHNLGMASGKIAANNGNTAADGTVTENNGATGQYHCSFEYNDGSDTHKVYRMNGSVDETYTTEDFRLGKVAYDLNEYYLQARKLLAGAAATADGVLATHAATVPDASASGSIKYVLNYFANGDYQYARRSDALTGDITGITYLRTGTNVIEPNYLSNITRHNMAHTIDKPRAIFVDPSTASTTSATSESNFSHYLPLFNSAKQTDALELTEKMNDYIYWGQNLQLTPAIYPSTIESLQLSAMTNRVFRAVGYYGDTTPDAFHYNAYDNISRQMGTYLHEPTTTAIDFTCQADGVAIAPGVYPAETYKEGLQTVGTGKAYYPPFNDVAETYSSFNKGNANITQNLLVYTAADDAGKTGEAYDVVKTALNYNENTAEYLIKGHHVSKNADTFQAKYLHLVERTADDKNAEGVACINNDFCAPTQFNVTDRAWYTRVPRYYAESSNEAWEGICLPFTVNKAVASVNGEITHFYGTPSETQLSAPDTNDKTLHHEYWLRGLTGVTASDASPSETTATFQRPGEGLFYPADPSDPSDPSKTSQSSIPSYVFNNTWFKDTYAAEKNDKGYNYLPEQNDWYTDSHEYSDYILQTANIPYIVSFPGFRYYEFDLSSQFYNAVFPNDKQSAQTITFNGYGDNSTETNKMAITIPVTGMMTTSLGDDNYNHVGTYSAIESESIYAIDENGCKFVKEDESKVLPFRTYMMNDGTVNNAKGSDYQLAKQIIIGTLRTASSEEIGEEESDGGITGPHLYIYPKGNRVIIDSTYPTTLSMYTTSGTLMRILDVRPGVNTFSGFSTGIYIVGKKKIYLR